jgi:hypothetical protein
MTTIVEVLKDLTLERNDVRMGESQGRYGRDVMMADVIAHLISAYTGIEEIFDSDPGAMAEMVSFELATQSVCTALVVLDEVSRPASMVWEPENAETGTGRAGQSRQRGTPDHQVSEPNVLEIMLLAQTGLRGIQSDQASKTTYGPALSWSSQEASAQSHIAVPINRRRVKD